MWTKPLRVVMSRAVLFGVCMGVCVGACTLPACAAPSDQEEAPDSVAQHLRALYPNTAFQSIRRTALPGVYELVMGQNVAYTDENGRYFLFGHLYDMHSQTDLTELRTPALRTPTPTPPERAQRAEFPAQGLGNAIKTVRGNGARVLAVFSDPDCPYCKRLEAELARLDNVTLYTFLFPLESLHPEARARSIAVWCAPDRAKAWSDLVLTGKTPTLQACPNPVNDNLTLGASLGVTGTPTLIAADGRLLPGAMPAERIEAWLNLTSASTLANASGAARAPGGQ